MIGCTKAFCAALPAIGLGTENSPCDGRLVIGSWVPIAVLIAALETLSGTPWVGFEKCVYLNVAKLLLLMIQEPSALPICCHASEPLPVVPAWKAVKPPDAFSSSCPSR